MFPSKCSITPLTQKVILNSRGYWRAGGVFLQYLTCALRGNTFMASGPIDQNGQGSAVERSLRHAPVQYAVAQGHAALVWKVRPVGTSSLPVPEGSGTSEP